jgi:hypothetical protein
MTRHRLTLACALLAACGATDENLMVREPLTAYRAWLSASGVQRLFSVGPCQPRGEVSEELADLIRAVVRERFAGEAVKIYVDARTEVSDLYVDQPLGGTSYCIGVVLTKDVMTLVFQYNGQAYK